jgi:hypothetical protein
VGALLKNEQDRTLFEKLVFMQRNNRQEAAPMNAKSMLLKACPTRSVLSLIGYGSHRPSAGAEHF